MRFISSIVNIPLTVSIMICIVFSSNTAGIAALYTGNETSLSEEDIDNKIKENGYKMLFMIMRL